MFGPAGRPRLLRLALERPRRWFSDLHGDVSVERILLDLNRPVGQRADAVLLHGVLRVLDFIEPAGGGGEGGEAKVAGQKRSGLKVISSNNINSGKTVKLPPNATKKRGVSRLCPRFSVVMRIVASRRRCCIVWQSPGSGWTDRA